MRPLIGKIKPASGFSRFVHVGFNLLLPLIVLVLVRIDFIQLALAIIVLSKWRMFAVRPRFWLANIRANAMDIAVGLSFWVFMVHSGSQSMQLFWTGLWAIWLLVIKPGSSTLMISLQAMIDLLCSLMALFLTWGGASLYVLVGVTGLVCYLAARHFFDSFEEPYAKLLSYMWGYFGAALTWVLGHWLLFYGIMSQPALLLLAIGYSLATLYYLDHLGRLSRNTQRQIVFIMAVVIVITLIFSDWQGKII